MFPWPHAYARAEKAKQTLTRALRAAGARRRRDRVLVRRRQHAARSGGADAANVDDMNEVGLRVAVRTRARDEAEKVRRACSQLWIMGPGGTSFGVPMKPRPVVSLWPTFVPRALVPPQGWRFDRRHDAPACGHRLRPVGRQGRQRVDRGAGEAARGLRDGHRATLTPQRIGALFGAWVKGPISVSPDAQHRRLSRAPRAGARRRRHPHAALRPDRRGAGQRDPALAPQRAGFFLTATP